jgi:hypothetical protein
MIPGPPGLYGFSSRRLPSSSDELSQPFPITAIKNLAGADAPFDCFDEVDARKKIIDIHENLALGKLSRNTIVKASRWI